MSNFNRRDYDEYLTMPAERAIEATNDNEFSNIHAAIEDAVEGTEYVTYSAQARAVVFEYSTNGNIALDIWDWGHITSKAQNIQTVVVRMAHHAVAADVAERVLAIEEKRESLKDEREAEAAWEASKTD